MVDAAKAAEENIRQITECSICMNGFTDPRMLPCIHTFCFECIKLTVETEQKKPGDKIPCPLCRKEFTIPPEGIIGLQNNFFMETLMENLLAFKSNIGGDAKDESRQKPDVKYCSKHTKKPLDYYCADCKKIVCVSCFVESHKLHDCKDVTSVDEEFRKAIGKCARRSSIYANEMLTLKRNAEVRKTDFLKKTAENETVIIERGQELKDMIDKHTKSLLDELSLLKSKHLKEMKIQMEEIERCYTSLNSFEAYCDELSLKGSASDICCSVDQIIGRADELQKDHEAFLARPRLPIEVSFQATEFRDVFEDSKRNIVGCIKDGCSFESNEGYMVGILSKADREAPQLIKKTISQFEIFASVVGLSDGPTITRDVIKINLRRPNAISTLEQIPTKMEIEAYAAVYCNTMYVTGIGTSNSEIWRYNTSYGWMKCGSLVQGRSRHCAGFIGEVLYICGGAVLEWKFALANNVNLGYSFSKNAIDSVEAYNVVTDRCIAVGKLVHCVQNSGNCVPFKDSLYIFGGLGKNNKAFRHVQVYNTGNNSCSVLSTPMPRSYFLMRAAWWDSSVILVGKSTSLIFNFEKKTWQEREQLKTDVTHFGLVLENRRIFVIGGGNDDGKTDDTTAWKCRDDVRYVPLQNILDDRPIDWMIHGKLPKPCLVHACVHMRSTV